MYFCSNKNGHTAAFILHTYCTEGDEFVIATKPPLQALSNNRKKCIATVSRMLILGSRLNRLKC